MRYPPIDKELFQTNRQNLVKKIKPGSAIIVHSSDPLRLSGDGVLTYRQDSDFFYLTGIDQKDSVLIITSHIGDEKAKEILLIKETNEKIAIWEGEKLSLVEASDKSGIDNVEWVSQYDGLLADILQSTQHVYLDFNYASKSTMFPISKNERLGQELMKRNPELSVTNLIPLLTELRMIKSETECKLIKQAGVITRKGYERALSFIKPGIWEYEIEAEFISEFISHGSRGFAYNPIIASGSSGCVLHYEQNSKQCLKGDIVLLDVGAEYANYKADVTRTYPVNGKFSYRQKRVYQSVLKIKKSAANLLRPGITLKEYNAQIGELMEEELVQLRLLHWADIKKQNLKNPLYKKYYMHGTSHHLGLDVHDLSDRNKPIEPGMILTIEPGIYIREEGIGIRLEDDLLIGPDDNQNLTPDIPLEIDEIEELMH